MSADLVTYTNDQRRELCEQLGIKGTPQQITLTFKIAEKYGLDVLTKEISLIPNKGPFIGVWGRLHVAHRSGLLDGLEADDEWETDDMHHVRCVVWRKDMGHPAAKAIGRVRKTENKDWPYEIARARAIRAALGYAFSIHDDYDTDDDWTPPPDETIPQPPATPVTGDQLASPEPAAEAPKPRRRTIRKPEEPPTIQVGGHTPAQKIAIAARKAGIEDDQTRHDIITAATHGTYTAGKEIPDTDEMTIKRLLEAFDGLANGTIELRYDPDGNPKLWKVSK